MLHLLLYVIKRQLTICFKSLEPIQTGLCMLMSLSIHLHGLHTNAQYDQTRHLSTQLRSGERIGRRLLWSTTPLVTDSTIQQPGLDLLNCFQTGQGPCHANLHKWGLAQSPSCDCGQQQTMNHIVDTCPLRKFEGGLNLLHKADDDTAISLKSTATVALTKSIPLYKFISVTFLHNILSGGRGSTRLADGSG